MQSRQIQKAKSQNSVHDSLKEETRRVADAFEKNIINSNRRTSVIYPNCTVINVQYLGDGRCDNYKDSGDFNSLECGFDGGDCIEFNEKYPNCAAFRPDTELGNGYCQYNTEECGFDGGDCIEFNEKYPNCTARYPGWIGDGECTDYPPYNTEECGFDGGDCLANADCSGLQCHSAGVIVGIVVALAVTGLGLCYFGSKRQNSAETETPTVPTHAIPEQQYPDKKYSQPGGRQWYTMSPGL